MRDGFETGMHNSSLVGKSKVQGDGQECPYYPNVVVSLTIARCYIAE
jgi:hypothetical protein